MKKEDLERANNFCQSIDGVEKNLRDATTILHQLNNGKVIVIKIGSAGNPIEVSSDEFGNEVYEFIGSIITQSKRRIEILSRELEKI